MVGAGVSIVELQAQQTTAASAVRDPASVSDLRKDVNLSFLAVAMASATAAATAAAAEAASDPRSRRRSRSRSRVLMIAEEAEPSVRKRPKVIHSL